MTDQPAHRVPFRLLTTRRDVLVLNSSDEDLPWVRVEPAPGTWVTPVPPGSMAAGYALRMRCALATQQNAALMITWIRNDGDGPFIWRAVI